MGDKFELTIRLFGSIEVVTHEGMVNLPSKRSAWLLGILALRGDLRCDRQTLAGMIWPDSSDEAALHNLRQMLVRFRRALGPAGQRIDSVGRSICLNTGPDVWIDVVEFDKLFADGRIEALEQAADLYRGQLLVECHEPFAIQAREHRDQSFLILTDRLGAFYQGDGEYTKAVQIYRRAFSVDPYREGTARSLMESLAELGEAAAALEVYRKLRRSLRNDLGSEPDSATKGLYRAIREGLEKPKKVPIGDEPSFNRLPKPLTALIGRESEIKEISSAFGLCRLVTLVGVGGVGKTRLALAVAEAVSDNYLEGATFVDLSQVQDPRMVPGSIAGALKAPEQAGRPLVEALCEWLSSQSRLIVVDNCEHLIGGAGEVLERLLSSAPGVHVLATSRQLLGVPGEHVWRTPSLAAAETGSSEEELACSPSVKLFLERSVQSGKTARTSSDELRVIGSICRRLDGIPLAIEFAAARTNVLTVADIEERLKDRFELLEGGSRSVPRHQTLRAAMEWSWELLTSDEKDLLATLSVFRGGATFRAIEAVYDAAALNLLSNLVDRSLVVFNRDRDGSRFSTLETVRQYAAERLNAAGGLDTARTRHRDYYYRWAQELCAAFDQAYEFPWVIQLESDHDNLRAALDWSHSQGDRVIELHLAVCLSSFWDTYGHLREGRRLLERALPTSTADLPQDLVAEAHEHAGWMAHVDDDGTSACDHFERALGYFRQTGNKYKTARNLNLLAASNTRLNEFETANTQYEESVALFRELERPGAVATVLSNQGEAALRRGDFAAARRFLEQSVLECGPVGGSVQRLALTSLNFALLELKEDNLQESIDHGVQALTLFNEAQTIVSIPWALDLLAIVESRFGNCVRAMKLFGAAEVLSQFQGVPPLTVIEQEREAAFAICRKALREEEHRVALQAGKQMSLEGAVTFGLEG